MFLKFLKTLFIVLLLVVLFLPAPAKAADEFSSSYDITYSVGEDGMTTVTEDIKLKNLTDKFFPSSFTLVIPGKEVFDIEASDKQGPLQTEIAVEGGDTKLKVNFTNQQIIGAGKEYTWKLEFKDLQTARHLGKVWSVNIPKIAQQTPIEDLKLVLSVPVTIGDPDFITPTPARTTESGGRVNLIFGKDELTQSGISAIFGNNLAFEFEASYFIHNNSIFPGFANVVLPSDSVLQNVYLENIEPKPENTQIDSLGNTIAAYKLNLGESKEVKVRGNIKTFLYAKEKQFLSQDDRELFTQEGKFWDRNNPILKGKLAEILKGKEGESEFEKAKVIDKYVSNFLKFDLSRIEKNDFARFGTVTALNNPDKALAAEFVDLEIALMRAAGIPARQVIGFSLPYREQEQSLRSNDLKPYTFQGNVLHTWLEFYDTNQGWVIADPAWENSGNGANFFAFNDLSHLRLAVSGGGEDFVLPSNLQVKVLDAEVEGSAGAEIDINISQEILSGFPSQARVRINNLGSTVFPANTLQISTSKILLEGKDEDPSTSKLIQTPQIPPFGHLEYEFNLKTGAIWHSYQDVFQVNFAGVDDTRLVTVVPILSYKIFAIEIFGGLAIILLFYILILLVHHKSSKSA